MIAYREAVVHLNCYCISALAPYFKLPRGGNSGRSLLFQNRLEYAMKEKLPEILTELRHYFETFYGERLVQLILYGSQARGDARSDSDIDVLVILKDDVNAWEEIDRTGEFTAALCLEHTVVISRAFVSLLRFQSENSPFFLNVRREGIPI